MARRRCSIVNSFGSTNRRFLSVTAIGDGMMSSRNIVPPMSFAAWLSERATYGFQPPFPAPPFWASAGPQAEAACGHFETGDRRLLLSIWQGL
jgi:hypothetical protein